MQKSKIKGLYLALLVILTLSGAAKAQTTDALGTYTPYSLYGIGEIEEYRNKMLTLNIGVTINREKLIEKLIEMLYERNDIDFKRGTFRAKGDIIDIIPISEHTKGIRIELF